jgi:hypothetical protein
MPRSPYDSIYEKLVANTHEPENGQACWNWKLRRCRYWYGKTTLWVPGLGKSISLYAHVLMYCLLESGVKTANDAYLAYIELRESDLEVDHLCSGTSCISPDHLEAVTKKENCARRGRRP